MKSKCFILVAKMYASNILGLIFSILETYVFIGIFYGWHEMNRILKVSDMAQTVIIIGI